ncbi:MAG TPA: hypothetical protein VII69_05400 [Candidatus Eremiobacteraceae bacterium]
MQYRECARSIYNKYFKDWGDGSHDFLDVNREHAEFIRVRYDVPENGLDIDRLSGKHENMNKWSLWTLKDSSTELAFVQFFDWSNTWDYKDFDSGLSIGERLLIDIRYVKFEEVDDK